uniref:Uncharacterized protein n=1 Tax=Anopheles albimanus TaxID=7167 RepID=A0A182FYY4_ANOAL
MPQSASVKGSARRCLCAVVEKE